jgi:hypothetical protein
MVKQKKIVHEIIKTKWAKLRRSKFCTRIYLCMKRSTNAATNIYISWVIYRIHKESSKIH